ncbi:MAG: 2,3-bisphosphoglycerate-independent phosphoglycerate mutase [Thermoleophilia bacterium]
MSAVSDDCQHVRPTYRPVVLVILDGWGVAPAGPGNAISLAPTPTFDRLEAECVHGTLVASGTGVGLPVGQMGNSEVGHLNIGAGRVVYQDLTRISAAIADGSFFRNPVLVQACAKAAGRQSTLHLLGLVSDGGVHSDLEHLKACLDLAQREHVGKVVVHAFLDGRDTLPRSARGFLAEIQQYMDEIGLGRFGTVCGRYYAMDRDNRWDRVEKAYRALVGGDGLVAASADEAVVAAYGRGENDEFVLPTIIAAAAGGAAAGQVSGDDVHGADPDGRVKGGDVCLFFNFRPDRARQLTRAFYEADFAGFARGRKLDIDFVTMTEYKREFPLPVAFPPEHPTRVLAEVLAEHGLHQLHIAETEKYAHVTFFFNGGVEREYPGETRILVPSPREVPTYDHKPEMSAFAITDRLLEQLRRASFDFVIVNFANADMVGHTGVIPAAIAAVTVVDTCLGRIVDLVNDLGGVCLVTADHGNAEQMLEPDGGVNTAHSTNPVPFIATTVTGVSVRSGGCLADIAPTILHLLGLSQPAEMSGSDLLVSSLHL